MLFIFELKAMTSMIYSFAYLPRSSVFEVKHYERVLVREVCTILGQSDLLPEQLRCEEPCLWVGQ